MQLKEAYKLAYEVTVAVVATHSSIMKACNTKDRVALPATGVLCVMRHQMHLAHAGNLRMFCAGISRHFETFHGILRRFEAFHLLLLLLLH